MAFLGRHLWLAIRATYPKKSQPFSACGCKAFATSNRLEAGIHPHDDLEKPNQPPVSARSPPKDFYEFYLDHSLPKTKVEPLPWIDDRDPRIIHENLPEEFRNEPLAVLQSAKANVELVGQCLEAFIIENHSNKSTLDDTKEALATTKAGTRTLSWLVGSGVYEETDLSLNPRLLKTLIHCLAAEKGDHFIWQWLRIDHTPKSLADLPIRQRRSWKGVALLEFIRNDVFWYGENRAISNFLRARQWSHGLNGDRNKTPRAPEHFIPCHQAGIWLYRRLAIGRIPDTAAVDAQLFESFIRTVPVFERDPAEAELSMCNLFLRHPTSPTAEPAFLHIMSWARPWEHSEYMTNLLASTHPGVVGYLRTFVIRVAQMLNQHDTAAARHVLDVAKEVRPDLFRMQRDFIFSKDQPGERFVLSPPSDFYSPSHAPERTETNGMSERARAIEDAYIRQGYQKAVPRR